MSVIFLPEIQDYLNNLIPVLYGKGYFSYEEQAQIYIDGLVDDIQNNLSKKRHKPAPSHYDKYGKGLCYAAFTKNRRTTWYPFFTKHVENGKIIYLVRYIGNNHTEAHHLYEGF
jgi:hypothetical protein